MINIGRETDGNNQICLGVRFALCIFSQHCFLASLVMFLYSSSFFFQLPCCIGSFHHVFQIVTSLNAPNYNTDIEESSTFSLICH